MWRALPVLMGIKHVVWQLVALMVSEMVLESASHQANHQTRMTHSILLFYIPVTIG